ncbi:hypothetical protein KRMM14A1004_01710 [Krasilnikovia sp. MM14-A1004]
MGPGGWAGGGSPAVGSGFWGGCTLSSLVRTFRLRSVVERKHPDLRRGGRQRHGTPHRLRNGTHRRVWDTV